MTVLMTAIMSVIMRCGRIVSDGLFHTNRTSTVIGIGPNKPQAGPRYSRDISQMPQIRRSHLGDISRRQEIASVGVRENFNESHYANARRAAAATAAAGKRVDATAPELRAADVAMVRALP